MNISIIAVGKIRERYINSGIKEYQKRLSRYCKLKIIEVPDREAPETLSEMQLEKVKEEEGQDILKNIKQGSYVIALDINGKKMSSEEMAAHMDRLAVMGRSNLTFIIGGSNGLSTQVLEKADMRLSFSPMTFPHQLMRLILLEQIYRWFKIIKGEPYHK